MKYLFSWLTVILLAIILIACTSTKNEYGLPIDQWNSLTSAQQAYIKKTHTSKPIPRQSYQRHYEDEE